jgi:hypothetical protein
MMDQGYLYLVSLNKNYNQTRSIAIKIESELGL